MFARFRRNGTTAENAADNEAVSPRTSKVGSSAPGCRTPTMVYWFSDFVETDWRYVERYYSRLEVVDSVVARW